MQPTLWTRLFHFIALTPVSVGGTGSSELRPAQKSDYKRLPGSLMKNFSVGFSYLIH